MTASTTREMRVLDTFLKVVAAAVGGLLAVAGAFTQPEAWAAFDPPALLRYLVLPFLLGGLTGGIGAVALTQFNQKFEERQISE